jgi:hypothetical protein
VHELQKLRGQLAYWETRLRLASPSRRRELAPIAVAELRRMVEVAITVDALSWGPFEGPFQPTGLPRKKSKRRRARAAGGRSTSRTG